MLALEGKDFLRIAIFGGVLGFAVFCVSYSVLVWCRRNSRSSAQPTWTRRAAYLCTFLGGAWLLVTWAFSELEKREGIAGGSDLFVVHARRDNAALRLLSQDEVVAGDVVAEFIPPASQSELAVKEFQKAQAEVRKQAVRAKPLPIDQSLVQREAQIHSRVTQGEGFLLELQRPRREVEKGRSALLTDWTREKGQLEAEIASTEKLSRAATSQLDIARTAFQQASDALRKQLVTQPVYDERRSAFISAELEESKHQVALASLRSRIQELEERFRASDPALSQQLTQIEENTAKFGSSIEVSKAQLADLEGLLDEDRARAKASIEREVEAAELEASIAAAEKERSIETTQIKAPFAGRVVFRHPTPGLAAEGAPILALSAGSGFLARVRLPHSEVDELASSPEAVPLALEHPVVHNIITGRFVRAEPLPMERGQAIALFECTLPSEVIAGLGSSAEPVRVRLIWKPSLLATTDFQISAALVVLGLLGIMFSGHRSQASEKPIESVDHSSSKHNEPHLTPGAAASVISAQGKDASKGSSAEVVDIRSRKPLELHQGTLEHTDALTGLANRSHFLSIAEVEVQKASQSGGALAVLLLSIDQLRQINTVHGRKAGDVVLKELAGLCRGSRERDVSARWTGEEFVLLLPETDHAGARVAADRLSWGAEQLQFRDIPHLQAAISIGVAELLPGEASVLPALLRASQARDAAENGRRNGTTDTWDT